MKSRITTEIDQTNGYLLRTLNPGEAVRALDRVMAYYERQATPIALPRPLTLRAAAWLQSGDTTRAVADLTRALDLADHHLAESNDPWSRQALRESRDPALRTLLSLALARRDTARAFGFAERLGGATGSSSAAGLSVGYVLLGDRVLIWLLRDGKTVLREHRITERRLLELSERFTNGVRRGAVPAVLETSGTPLSLALLGSLDSLLKPGEPLALSLDPKLATLPIGALRLPSSGRYLVEDYVLRFGWSGSPALRRETPAARPSILVVGVQHFDRGMFPDLGLLPGAGEEATTVAGLYRRAKVLRDSQASREAVLLALPRHSILHFAGHARSVLGRADLSHLVLAPASGGIGANVIYGREIADLDLSGVELVVLSACGTLDRSPGSGSSVSALAQAFLAAGVQGVIGGIWEVEDASTTALMAAFHRGRLAGLSAPAALQGAQRDAIARGITPARWSGFRYEGR